MCNAHDKILFTSVLDKQKSRPINRGTVVSNKTKLILIMFVHAFLYCDAESIGISCFQTKKIQHTYDDLFISRWNICLERELKWM